MVDRSERETPALVKVRAQLLDTNQAASYLGVTPRTLEVWRCTKRQSIPYLKVGRLVKYRVSDLDAWLDAHLQNGEAA